MKYGEIMSTEKKVFLIFASEGSQTQKICDDLKSVTGVQILAVASSQEASSALKSGEVTSLVLVTPKFDGKAIKLIGLLRETKKSLSVIVFANSVEKDIYTFANTTRLRRVAIMEIPYKKEELKIVCEKVMIGQDVYQRNHGRFNVDQAVQIARLPSTEKFSGTIKNMSLGGAYISVEGRLDEMDTVKNDISIPGQEETVYGEVIRVEPNAFGDGLSGVGVRFITQESLYRALLAKLR